MNYLKLYKGKLIEVFYNYEVDSMAVGYIINEDDNYIILKNISPLGFEDGYSLILKNEINKINYDTKYLKEVETLMFENSKENILNSYLFKNKDIEFKNENILNNTLNLLKDKQIVCVLVCSNDKIFGFIKEIIDNEYIIVEYKKEKTLLKISDIDNVYIDAISYRRDLLFDK